MVFLQNCATQGFIIVQRQQLQAEQVRLQQYLIGVQTRVASAATLFNQQAPTPYLQGQNPQQNEREQLIQEEARYEEKRVQTRLASIKLQIDALTKQEEGVKKQQEPDAKRTFGALG